MRYLSFFFFSLAILLCPDTAGLCESDTPIPTVSGGTIRPAPGDGSNFFDKNLTREEQAWIKAHPILTAGMVNDRPPFGFTDAQGVSHGMIPDYLQLIANRLQVSLDLTQKPGNKAMTWNEIMAAVKSNRVDIYPWMIEMPGLEQYLNFSAPYIHYPWALIARKNHGTSGKIEDFRGKKLLVVEFFYLNEKMADRYPDLYIQPVQNPLAGLKAVAGRQADALIVNAAVGAYLIRQHQLKPLEIIGLVGSQDANVRMAVQKGRSMLLGIINKALKDITPEEQAAIHNQWVAVDLEKHFDWAKFMKISALPAMLVLTVTLLVIIANKKLKKEIAKRKLLEDEAKASREEFRIIADYTYGLETWYDDTEELRWINPSVEKILGYTQAQCMAMNDFPTPLLAPGDVDKINAIRLKALSGKSGSNYFLKFKRKDGEERWLSISWNPVFKNDGSFFGYRVSGLDRTEQKAAEKALKESETLGRLILEAAGEGLFGVDTSGTVIFINKAALSKLGYTKEEIKGHAYHSLIHYAREDGSEYPYDQCPVYQCYTRGEEIRTDHDILWKKDGTNFPVAFITKPIKRDREILGAVVSFIDISEKLKAKKEIQKQNKQLRFLTDTADIYYWRINTITGELTYDATNWFVRKGYPEEEIPRTREKFEEKIHPEDMKQIEVLFDEKIQSRGKNFKTTFRFHGPQKDQWFWIESTGRFIEWNNQEAPSAIIGVNKDVTEHQQLLEQVRQSQERLRIISDHTYDWQSWQDLEGNLIWINRAVERTTGYSTAECMTMPNYPEPLIEPGYWERHQETTATAVREKSRQEVLLRIQRKDGKMVWVSKACEPVMNEEGQVIGIASAAKDITHQKQAEHELMLISKVFKETADPIMITDLDGQILHVNQAGLDTHGYSRQELIGANLELLLPEEQAALGKNLHQKCIKGDCIHNIEWVRKKKDGSTMPVLLTLSVLSDDQGKAIGVASITKDLTDIKQAEQELITYRDHLEDLVEERTSELEAAVQVAKEATQAKSDFLANMSHEIRTPLNAVIGFAHLALQTQLDDSQYDYINKIQSSSRALLGIINDILDFSKIEAGRLTMEAIEFHLDEVLETITNIVGIKAQQKGLEVVFNIDPNLPQKLIGDPLRLGQILINLTGNAVKFTEKGEIVVGCRETRAFGDKIEIEFFVQDSGIGLSREQQGKLFQAFSQADASTTRKYGGTGLGLFISKSLVEMMEGRIWVTGELGHGTTFFFTVVMEKAGTRMIRALNSHAMFKDKKVLVVDDNAVCRTVLCAMLEAMEFRVVQASGAEQGIEEIEKASKDAPFDLVLMDWKMPGMDGLHASQKIKTSLGIKVPSVIMVSAYAREDLMHEANAIGLDGYLVKPVAPALLFETILAALGEDPGDQAKAMGTEALPSVEAIKGARLLVVEDNEINQQVARGILEHKGFIVETADNGHLGIEAVNKNSYDAVLMDIQMPEMDGYEACRRIRKNPALNHLPIIAMTANAMAGDREKALAAGMNDHVAKPIDVAQLLLVLRKWIRKDTSLKALASVQTDNNEGKDLSADFPDRLPGIDVKDGLGRMGRDPTLFQEVLIKFAANQAGVDERIAQALADQDLPTAQLLAHTAKGVAGNIGARKLFKTATDIDAALKTEDMDKAKTLLPVFGDTLNQVIQGIQSLDITNNQEAFCASDTVRTRLIALKKLLDDDDVEAADTVRKLKKVVAHGRSSELLEQLADEVGEYEFEEAQETLRDLCLECKIDLEE